MGLFLSQYVGPILLAKQHPEEEETRFRACSNTQCVIYRKPNQVRGKHCHECGTESKYYKGKPRIVRKPQSQDVINMLESFGLNPEALWHNDFAKSPEGHEDFLIYIPNNYLGSVPPRKFHTSEANNSSLLLSSVNPEFELEWFNETYSEYISKMSEVYDEIKTSWGIFNYQS